MDVCTARKVKGGVMVQQVDNEGDKGGDGNLGVQLATKEEESYKGMFKNLSQDLWEYFPEKFEFVGESSKGRREKGKGKANIAYKKVSKMILVTYVELESDFKECENKDDALKLGLELSEEDETIEKEGHEEEEEDGEEGGEVEAEEKDGEKDGDEQGSEEEGKQQVEEENTNEEEVREDSKGEENEESRRKEGENGGKEIMAEKNKSF
nr:high mobility group nucleosome-binding domain-containing protein 5-like [Malus domestica]